MRTTVNIDEDVLQAAKSLSQASGKPLGAILSELARRGLEPRQFRAGEGLPTFTVSVSSPVVTPEQIKAALDDDL